MRVPESDLVVDGLSPTEQVLASWITGPTSQRVVHVRREAARPGDTAPWPHWADPEVVAAFARRGAGEAWVHQVLAADLLHAGRHVWLGTGTASGKSLAYLLPVLTGLRRDRVGAAGAHGARGATRRGARTATALYLSPTKALAADQWSRIKDLALPGVDVAVVDGDTSQVERRWAREHANLVLTNPDLLHFTLLPGHARWASFLRRLAYVVVDEGHAYRGVFGAHVALVLRRLRRVAAHYGADPVICVASATGADPAAVGLALTGVEPSVVEQDDSPAGARTVVFWEPETPADGDGVRRPAILEAADLLADLVAGGVQTLVFVPSRRGAETVARLARERLASVVSVHGAGRALAASVAAYRGGYLPEERRDLEHRLRTRALMGVAATSALELGIDIAGLDAVVVCGWPGRRASFHQQIGRAGRRGGASLAVLVPDDDPLDTYVTHHPRAVFGEQMEQVRFDPGNPYVLGPHLAAAAAELPVRPDETPLFGPTAPAVLDQLTAAGMLRRRPAGWYWTHPGRAVDLADLRGGAGRPVGIVERATGRMVGTVDAAAAHAQVHPGAVYVHQGEPWLVVELDLEGAVALVERADGRTSTHARSVGDVRVLGRRHEAVFDGPAGEVTVAFGPVEVSEQVVGFVVREVATGRTLGHESLDLPRRTLRTSAVWWTVPVGAVAVDDGPLAEADLAGALHAAEHAAIGMLPLLATCDRWDVGGLSTALHPDTDAPTVFVHDGHPGGAGFAERGHEVLDRWLGATRDLVRRCPCRQGCPRCIQSPKCGNNNEPLHKAGAVGVLGAVLAARDRR